jgi:hypothetical protein
MRTHVHAQSRRVKKFLKGKVSQVFTIAKLTFYSYYYPWISSCFTISMNTSFSVVFIGHGTSWKSGVRRSTRIRTRPLEYWKGERLLYGRIHDSEYLVWIFVLSWCLNIYIRNLRNIWTSHAPLVRYGSFSETLACLLFYFYLTSPLTCILFAFVLSTFCKKNMVKTSNLCRIFLQVCRQ